MIVRACSALWHDYPPLPGTLAQLQRMSNVTDVLNRADEFGEADFQSIPVGT